MTAPTVDAPKKRQMRQTVRKTIQNLLAWIEKGQRSRPLCGN